MITKILDSKGRLALGPRFANQTVIVDDSDATRIVITPAKVIPEHEVWFYKNEEAMKSVLLGIKQAQEDRYATDPADVDADASDEDEMPFELKWVVEADEKYKALKQASQEARTNRAQKGKSKKSKQEGLFKQIAKTISYLKQNPKHPSLNCHEYSGIPHPYSPKEKVWEAYAQNNTPGAYRVFWCYGPGQECLTIIAITPHP